VIPKKIIVASNKHILSFILRVFRQKHNGELMEKLKAKGFNQRWTEKISGGVHGSSDRKLLSLAKALYEIDPPLFTSIINMIGARKITAKTRK